MVEPVMLHNPTGEVVEVMSDRVIYIFKPKESRIILGDVARQILKNQKTPLMRVEIQAVLPPQPILPVETGSSDGAVDYSKMSYKELQKIAATMGLFKVGTKGKDLIKLLNEQRKAA